MSFPALRFPCAGYARQFLNKQKPSRLLRGGFCLSINLKIYFCGGNAALFVFPVTCAAEKHLISEKPLNKWFFKGTGVVLAGIERSPKIRDFRASGIPVQERVENSTRSNRPDCFGAVSYCSAFVRLAKNAEYAIIHINESDSEKEEITLPKQKRSLNSVYISARLRESLQRISDHTLTAVTAPMGYGKTTAINRFISEYEKRTPATVIRINVYSDNMAVFWKSVSEAFAHAGYQFLREYQCPCDRVGGSMLADELCRKLASYTPCCIFIDDFHLLNDDRVSAFICTLADRAPENLHIIVAGRNRFLSDADIFRLGGRAYLLGAEHLRLNRDELKAYAGRCGIILTDEETDELMYSSEGWFSAVYLNLRAFEERGVLPKKSDIYEIFTSAMIAPLNERQREFSAVMSLADEFTAEEARYVTECGDTEALLTALTEQNAFIERLPDRKTYRFHNMMRECAGRIFSSLAASKQKACLERFGKWYESCGQYIEAMRFFKKSGNYDALLNVIRLDAGILLSSLEPDRVSAAIASCPEEILKKHPTALLVLMRSMFNWRKIPEMQKMRELLLAAIEEWSDMPQAERGNLLGECDLIMSFLMYNDISEMSRLHRSADRLMSRPAVSIRKNGGWTFGSPSVLMMFHRSPGELNKELAEMDECMPHYYKLTDGHGMGAEKIMYAEAEFMRGSFTDAQIALESAYAETLGNGQENMTVCCDFLALRLSLNTDTALKYTVEQRHKALLQYHNSAWLNIFNAACAYFYAVLSQNEKIPDIFKEHNLSAVNILAPGKPMIMMIENKVYLSQGAFAEVIANGERLLSICETMNYGLVALHLQIHIAAAYECLDKRGEAVRWLKEAVKHALPDNLVMPFVENYPYIEAAVKVLQSDTDTEFIKRIIRLGESFSARVSVLLRPESRPSAFACLTEREYILAGLIAERLSNREIAERMFLTEGSVKQYINQLYSKLGIDGDTRTKRKRLTELTKG